MVCTFSTNFLKADFIHSRLFFLAFNSQEHVMMACVRYNFLTINGYSKSKLPIPAPAKLEQPQAQLLSLFGFFEQIMRYPHQCGGTVDFRLPCMPGTTRTVNSYCHTTMNSCWQQKPFSYN